MFQLWDRAMHYLVMEDPDAFLELLLPGVELRFLHFLPEKLEGSLLIMDVFFNTLVVKKNCELLIHIEFETYYNSEMPDRLSDYNKEIRRKYKRDAISGVFHLEDDTAIKPSPLVWKTPLDGEWSYLGEFRYPSVEMKNLTPEFIRSKNSPVLFALLPFTEGGATLPVARGMLDDLIKHGNEKLTQVAFQMALRKLPAEDKELLKKEYPMEYGAIRIDPLILEIQKDSRKEGFQEGVQSMQESMHQAIQEAIQKAQQSMQLALKEAVQEAIQNMQQAVQSAQQTLQAMQQAAIDVVSTRFPMLLHLAQRIIPKVNDPQRLKNLFPRLSTLPSQEELKDLLASLDKDPAQESTGS